MCQTTPRDAKVTATKIVIISTAKFFDKNNNLFAFTFHKKKTKCQWRERRLRTINVNTEIIYIILDKISQEKN